MKTAQCNYLLDSMTNTSLLQTIKQKFHEKCVQGVNKNHSDKDYYCTWETLYIYKEWLQNPMAKAWDDV